MIIHPRYHSSAYTLLPSTGPADIGTAVPVESNPSVTVIPASPQKSEKLHVAAYCRVSTDSDSQENSIINQRLHYLETISYCPNWTFVDIYWEQGVSGTSKEKRPELQRLLTDCRNGKIDLVITKSISRFSRNITDCLKMTRTLSALGIRILFEKEHIDTGHMESECLLSLLSAFAESESHSISSNVKMGIRHRFETGTYKSARDLYGYRRTENSYVICEPEAGVIRRIFASFLSGESTGAIANALNADGIPTWSQIHRNIPNQWRSNTVRSILQNPFYIGDCVYQKTYTDESFRQHVNHGEHDQYLKMNDHEAIVERETFAAVKAALARNSRSSPQKSLYKSLPEVQ